ncbi:MAG: Mor transcription activator family protein [Wohlfahrtiimonas sp.]
MEAKRHEVIDDIIVTVKNVVIEVMPERNEAVAEIISNEVADRFVEKWAKATIYIPEDVNYKAQLKSIEIFEDYRNGKSIKEIASKNKASVQHIYNVIRKMREEYKKKVQPDLFSQ